MPAPVVVKGPHAAVEVPGPLIYEFGTMPQLSTGTHTWEFKNLGDADLELWFESSTCSCTVAKLKNGDAKKPKLVVKPNESTTIDLEWQTKTFHDDYTKGRDDRNQRPEPSVGDDWRAWARSILRSWSIPNEAMAFGTFPTKRLTSAGSRSSRRIVPR